MGNWIRRSKDLEWTIAEKEGWGKPHSLKIDIVLRDQQIPLLCFFQKTLYLCYRWKDFNRIAVRHYFVTDRKQLIQFGEGDSVTAAVEICADHYDNVYTEKEVKFNDAVRMRMLNVCGARGHSLALRNSEHFAKYIASGSWVSHQMFPGAPLHQQLLKHMDCETRKLINALPVEIDNIRSRVLRPVFRKGKGFLEYVVTKSIVADAEVNNACNVLVLGPTGSGKSNIINLLFNKQVCASAFSACSVTRHMQIIQARAPSEKLKWAYGENVNVIDSIGFCDSELSPEEVLSLVKQHIKSTFLHIDKVVIVCASGRFEQGQRQSIQNIMKWLNYKDYPYNFALVLNKADLIDEQDREMHLAEVCGMLGMCHSNIIVKDSPYILPSTIMKGHSQNSVDSVPLRIATGFPPDAEYAQVEDDLHHLLDVLFVMKKSTRIPIDPSRCALL
eukprot:TRINITY_DN24360_c1_g5_i1.p1 TRINITY_DN24360_c1_g5~~TRINITY_DN24360_c1_g5_i1.p1  ORF type:complete len:444 (-),score=56.58 TRINITY_DN24360_c1_g5_i1:458-1789(-)